MSHGRITLDLTDMKNLAREGRTPQSTLTDEYGDVVIKLSDGARDWFERNDVAEWGSDVDD